MTAPRTIELSDLEVRHIDETVREVIAAVDDAFVQLPEALMDDLVEILRIIRMEKYGE